MKQERVQPVRRTKPRPAEAVDDVGIEEPDADLLTGIDELLDEIDAVLEDQAMLTEFRQRSGQ